MGKRVLVIEDEMLVLMGIEDMLSDLGCTSITVAGTVKTALATIAANTFDFAMLDVNLDGTPSYAVADALKCHHIPFAFSTGYGQHGVAEGYEDRPVLNKPYSPFHLQKVIGGLGISTAKVCLPDCIAEGHARRGCSTNAGLASGQSNVAACVTRGAQP